MQEQDDKWEERVISRCGVCRFARAAPEAGKMRGEKGSSKRNAKRAKTKTRSIKRYAKRASCRGIFLPAAGLTAAQWPATQDLASKACSSGCAT